MNDEKNMKNKEGKVSDNKKEFIAWVKKHKKILIIVGISVPTVIAVVMGLKNEETIKELRESLKKAIEEADLYSAKWFDTASDEMLNTEREKVRFAYGSSGDNMIEAGRLQNLLWRFDKELSKRAWGDEVPHASSIHREHGRYLPNDD